MDHTREGNVSRLERKVDMVCHEAVSDQAEFVALAVMRQTAQIEFAIGVVMEDGLAFVAPDDHVVQGAGELDSRRPGHRAA